MCPVGIRPSDHVHAVILPAQNKTVIGGPSKVSEDSFESDQVRLSRVGTELSTDTGGILNIWAGVCSIKYAAQAFEVTEPSCEFIVRFSLGGTGGTISGGEMVPDSGRRGNRGTIVHAMP